jgi:hypothetical protein
VRGAAGSLVGAIVAALVAPLIKPLFAVPTGGVGLVTVAQYPKGWDYAVVTLLFAGAFLGAAFVRRPALPPASDRRRGWPEVAALVFVLMFLVHDHPYVHMDPFHEGEHLTPAFLMREGARPYGDVFLLHGLAIDGGLDALVLGSPPSPLRMRRVQTVLDALTLALLVPIAAEVTATAAGMALAVLLSICAIGAGQVPVFPYHRLLPAVLAALFLLRYARTGRGLLPAFLASTLGVLWGLDTGSYALAATVAVALLLRPRRVAIPALIALAAPFVVLLIVRADIPRFFIDSFVTIPRAIDAVWARPAPADWKTAEALRYYLPPAIYGFVLAMAVSAWRRGDRARALQLAILSIFSIVMFRTAAGRVSWSHTRFATPFLGIVLVAFILEPLVLLKRRVVAVLLAIPLWFFVELAPNVVTGAKLIAGWNARQKHDGMVRYRSIWTSPQNAETLATLATFIDTLGPKDATILDFSNERALYYLLRRRPPSRCFDIPMLSSPSLRAEAMQSLAANPPVAVIVEGDPVLFNFDGVTNRQRVPELAAWIDANYAKRTTIGRFVVGTR